MRTRRIIAIFMIITSMLMQISYACTTSKQSIANTGNYEIHFSIVDYKLIEDYGCVNLILDNGDGANIGVSVSNIYPGVIYSLDTVLENSGSHNAKITGFSIESNSNNNSTDSQRLYDMIVGVKDDTTKVKLNEYIDYLNSAYIGKVISPGQYLPISLSMGMDENVTDLENIICDYQIIVNFEQVTYNDEDNDEDDHNGENDHNEKEENKDTSKNENNDESMNEDSDNHSNEKSSVPSIQEEKPVFITKSNNDVLPNTGEKSPVMVYGLGLVLMLGGILLLKKNDVKE